MKRQKERQKKVIRVSKNHFNVGKEYKKCLLFLRESKNFIYSAILIFFIFTALGFFFGDLIDLFFKSVFGLNLNDQILAYIKNLLLQIEGMSTKQLMGFIFFNNLQSSFLGMIFGIFLGIFPLVAIISNGYVLGFVAMLSVKVQGAIVLWRIFPHGIFELPAIFISLGLGLRFGMFIFRHKKFSSFKDLFLNSLRVFLFIVLPLLIIAAIIEGSLIMLIG